MDHGVSVITLFFLYWSLSSRGVGPYPLATMTKVALCKMRSPTKRNPKRRVYILRWYDSQGRRCGRTVGQVGKLDKRQAEHLRRQLQGEFDLGTTPIDRPTRLTLAAFLQRDREAVSVDVSARTIRELEDAADHAIRALGADLDVHKIDHAAIGRLKRYLSETVRTRKGNPLAPATVGKVIRKLQSAFTRGTKRGDLRSNPFAGVTVPKVQANRIRTYRPEEVEAMLAVTPDLWWEAFIGLAYTSGLRRGELLNLQWADVDLDRATVSVSPKRAGSFTVDGVDYPILEWSAKAYHSRTVPIPAQTVTVLGRLKVKADESPYVFLSLDRLARIRQYVDEHGRLSAAYTPRNNLRRTFTAIQVAAADRLSEGLDKPWAWETRTIHDLRRSYGTLMAERRLPIHQVRRLLGHSSIRTTEGYYLALGTDLSDEVRQAFAPMAAPSVSS